MPCSCFGSPDRCIKEEKKIVMPSYRSPQRVERVRPLPPAFCYRVKACELHASRNARGLHGIYENRKREDGGRTNLSLCVEYNMVDLLLVSRNSLSRIFSTIVNLRALVYGECSRQLKRSPSLFCGAVKLGNSHSLVIICPTLMLLIVVEYPKTRRLAGKQVGLALTSS